ncbi:MAG: hypothetical protein Q7S76_02865 [bacterium]|nr:hypothetical protein [bacterium]
MAINVEAIIYEKSGKDIRPVQLTVTLNGGDKADGQDWHSFPLSITKNEVGRGHTQHLISLTHFRGDANGVSEEVAWLVDENSGIEVTIDGAAQERMMGTFHRPQILFEAHTLPGIEPAGSLQATWSI